MSQSPVLPMFVDAMIADTTHLSAEEFGAYHLILYATWRNNGKPPADDDVRMARICRMTVVRWRKLKPTLSQFFDLSEGTWRQKRLEKEWLYVSKHSDSQREKANKRWRAKSLENNDTDNAAASSGHNPEDMPNGCPHTHTHKESPIGDSSSQSDDRGALQAMGTAWNQICGDVLTKVKASTPQRRQKMRKRLKEDFGGSLDQWRAYLHRIRQSPVLTGENDRGWRATFDWALEPRNLVKVLEGNYDRRTPPKPEKPKRPQASEVYASAHDL